MRWLTVSVAVFIGLICSSLPTGANLQLEPAGIISDSPNEVYRRFEAPEDASGPVFSGELMSLYSLGVVEASVSIAEETMRSVPTFVGDFHDVLIVELERETGIDIDAGEPRRVPTTQYGDETVAYLIHSQYGTINVEFGMLVIRHGAWIQLLAAPAFNDDGRTVATLEQVASSAKSRWPNTSTIHVRSDGLRVGGVWGLGVLPEDVPDHLQIDRGYDEGPGPAPTPLPSTEPPVRTGDRQEAEEPSSRLAEPFNVMFRVILAGSTFSSDAQGQCSGKGSYSYLREGGLATIKTADGVEELVLVRSLEPGYLTYDLELDANVCVIEIPLENVPARADYLLLSHTTPIDTFHYDEISTGDVVEVVVEE